MQCRGARPGPDYVALLAEGVDRNGLLHIFQSWRRAVALLAEGVDRNRFAKIFLKINPESPSSRRAWIEIKRGKAKARQ